MTTLIVTEKPNVAARIANSLGKGSEKKLSRNGVFYHQIGDVFIVPAVGHIYGLREKNKGAWRYPVFDIEWAPSYEISKNSAFTRKYLDNLKFLAKKCDSFINACDYDIEGEVIAFNVLRFACNVDPLSSKVHRMKFSTLTTESILKAYGNLEKIDRGMADAGLTRHTLDWFWGINMSRALTLSVRKSRGYVTLSIGRVQGPTLKILAAREAKIKAFKPELYWQVEMISRKDSKKLNAFHSEDRIWEKEKADSIKKRCGDSAIVENVRKKRFEQKPPTPFDLTTLQTEAYKHLAIDPRRTLELAQELYTNAYISYPRTSSQQLPKGIDYKGIIKKIGLINEYKGSVDILLAKEKLKPNNGRKKDPAHPAIHPTGEIPRGLGGQAGKIYDLIIKRFLATFGDSAFRETVEIRLNNNTEIFIAKGTRTVELGWHNLYGRYVKFEEQELPEVKKDEKLKVEDVLVHEKETKPPKRYTPASIIREMEKQDIGTKATRSQIVDILFRRGYVTGKAIEVTPLGLNVVNTLEKYCPNVLSEKLTRKFEKEMEKIRKNKVSSEKVIGEGREILTRLLEEFRCNESRIGDALASSVKSMKSAGRPSLGKCFRCDGSLVMRKSKLGQFIGCSNYPNCTFTMSLPKGKIVDAGRCEQCGYSILKVADKNRWSFCINPKCPSKRK